MRLAAWTALARKGAAPVQTGAALLCLALFHAVDGVAQQAPAQQFQGDSQQVEGFSQPYRIARLAASTSGILKERHVAEGERVEKGQPLLSLDATVTKSTLHIARAVLEAQGEHAAAEAEYKLREARLLALRELTVRGHATDEELQRAETEYELAAARLQTIRERRHIRKLECAKLEAELAAYCVRAPFDGVVTKFHKTPGEYVGPGDVSVCTIAELTTLSVEFLVSRDLAQCLEVGVAASVRFLESGATAGGKVCFRSPFSEGETGMFFVRIRIDNQRGALTAGERCLLLPGLQFPAEQHATQNATGRARKGTVSK